MPNVRHERVRELLKREIGEAIRREFHVNDVGIITVNDVDIGGDLKSAVVFIEHPRQCPAPAKAWSAGAQQSPQVHIQGLAGKASRPGVIKYTPHP